MNTTPMSLLERLRLPSEMVAWDRFVELYTPLLKSLGLTIRSARGLRDPDAADFVQDFFMVLVRELPRFHYESGKRFRGWLRTVTLNKCREVVSHQWPEVADPTNDFAEIDEAEYRKYPVDRALQLMRVDFQPTTWKACWEYAVVGRPAAEVAAELGITTNAVHMARSRVLRRLRQELQGLLD